MPVNGCFQGEHPNGGVRTGREFIHCCHDEIYGSSIPDTCSQYDVHTHVLSTGKEESKVSSCSSPKITK